MRPPDALAETAASPGWVRRLWGYMTRHRRDVVLAVTAAVLGSVCQTIIPLIERGLIDCITTTGANLYHDAHRIIGHRIREIDPTAGDLQYRLARIIRIYDLGFWEETLLETDKLFSALLQLPDFQKRMTTPEQRLRPRRKPPPKLPLAARGRECVGRLARR